MIDLNKLVKDFKAHIDSLTDEEMAEMQRKAEHDSQDCRDWYIEERVEIPFGEYKIVAEKGFDPNYNEIFIFLEDKNGVEIQNIAIVGQKYHYDEDCNIVHDDNVLVRVFTDKDDEDYTNEFEIGVYKEEE